MELFALNQATMPRQRLALLTPAPPIFLAATLADYVLSAFTETGSYTQAHRFYCTHDVTLLALALAWDGAQAVTANFRIYDRGTTNTSPSLLANVNQSLSASRAIYTGTFASPTALTKGNFYDLGVYTGATYYPYAKELLNTAGELQAPPYNGLLYLGYVYASGDAPPDTESNFSTIPIEPLFADD